jgi:Na+-driven multidrug efflux pump
MSRAIGSGNETKQKAVFYTAFTLAFIVSIAITLIGFFLSTSIISWMGGTGKMLDFGSCYYKHCSLGSFFTVTGLTLNALIRAEGKMKQAMVFTGVSVLINAMLAPLFINFFDFGIAGAAWASNVAMMMYLFLVLNYFSKHKPSFQLANYRLQLDVHLVRNIITIGLSSFLLQAGNFIRQTIIFKSVAHYGSDQDVAFFGAAFRIFSIAVTPVFGILQCLQPIVGVNYGAGNYERCTKSVSVFRIGGGIFLAMLWIPLLLFPQSILSLMLPDHAVTFDDLLHFRILFLTMPFLPIASSGIIYFQAIGKGNISSSLSIGRELLLFTPIILLIPSLYGVSGIYYGIAIENAIYILFVLIFTFYKFNKLRSLQLLQL